MNFTLKNSMVSLNGVQQIDANPSYAGDPNPHTVYGFGANIRYKKFAFTLNAGGAGGFLIYNNTATNITNIEGITKWKEY